MNPNTPQEKPSFSNAWGTRYSRPIPGNQTSEAVQALKTVLTKKLEAFDPRGEKIDLIAVEGSPTLKLFYAALVFVYRDAEKKDLLSYYTMVIADSNAPLEPRFENYQANQARTEITLVPGDVFDRPYIDSVDAAVKQMFPGFKKYSSADGRVIPKGFNLSDDHVVTTLLDSVYEAAAVKFMTDEESAQEIQLSDVRSDPSAYQIRPSFGHQDKMDAVGQMVRADWEVNFSTVPQRNQQLNGSLNGDTQQTFTRAYGFIDLLQTYQRPISPFFQQAPMPGQPLVSAKFLPNIIVTGIDAPGGPHSLYLNLLAMFTVFSFTEPRSFYRYFLNDRQGNDKGINYRDAGALNIKANYENNPNGVGAKISTTGADFNEGHLYQLLDVLLEPSVLFSIDVPEVGEGTWVNAPFAMAASTDEDTAKWGNAQLWQALNYLTGGYVLEKHIPKGAPLVVRRTNRIPLGDMTITSGEKRDVRTIDYLYSLNYAAANGNLEIADQYVSTFVNRNIVPQQRLSDRIQLFRNMQPSFIKEGVREYASRVTFLPEAVVGIINAITESGLNVSNVQAFNQAGFNDSPVFQDFANMGVPMAAHAVYNRAPGVQAGMNTPRGNVGRFF